MQIDRGFIKWLPFDSVVSTKNILKKCAEEKRHLRMPILSEEQLKNNEELIILAFQTGVIIKLTFFKVDKIYQVTSKIQDIIPHKKKIILTNKMSIYFSQIINISYD